MPVRTSRNDGFTSKQRKGTKNNSRNWNQRNLSGGRLITQTMSERGATVNSGHSRQQSENSRTENSSCNGDIRVVYDGKALQKKSERAFFNKFFEDKPKLLHEYNERISESPNGYIEWNFLPTLNKSSGPQYSKALNYVQREIAMARIDRPDRLRDLQILTEEVIKVREEDIARHQDTCDRWKRVNDAINRKQNEIKFLKTRIPDAKVDEGRRHSTNNFFLRLLCCCCS